MMRTRFIAISFALALAAAAAAHAGGVPSEPAPADAPLAVPSPELLESLAMGEWQLRRGDTLRGTLQKWCDRAEWTLVWNSPYDLPIQANLAFRPGTSFEDAVRGTLKAFWNQPKTVKGKAYRNHVLVIEGRTI